MRRLPVLLLAFLLAGCAGKSAGDPATADGGSTAPAGLGSMLGLVVDDAVRPLPQANVTANGPSGVLQAVTDPEGRFGFDGLAAGVYLVEVSKPFHITHQQAVTVVEGVEPEITKFLLTFEASSVPYATVYKYDGFYECGMYTVRLCANVNIATWIVVCANTGVCIGNVTQDHSLMFQYVEPGVDFLQTEMAWNPTSATGEAMSLLIGGGSEAELKEGVSLPAYNGTQGVSPLMLRISNHESPDSWCHQQEQCERTDVLNESAIGITRALLVQVDTGPTFPVADSCGVSPYDPHPCGAGFSFQQPFTLFTIAFYGYEPPADWLFSVTGELPPPPA
ncbi:MAG: Carboxypeptidase regulatory-like domain [Thermoplasmata archaeon]|nr:Carboxypeptidase regulatory-like domain [Thermoplasmata archaeon]